MPTDTSANNAITMIPIENRSPFSAEILPLLDREGREVSILVIVASFTCREFGDMELCAPQEPVCFADEHRADPATTSVLRESDACGHKPCVDVVVNGSAYAPSGRAETVIVELQVGDIHKRLRVSGDRRDGTPGAEPFAKLPIIYERAFGGTQTKSGAGAVSPTNPIGIGFRRAEPIDPAIQTDYPNIEHLDTQSEFPAGFGVIGRGWAPRLQFAGTYDEAWLKHQWPLPPRDFDTRHFQCAPEDQQSRVIRGGEEVRLVNMTADGLWRFRLPTLSAPAHLISDNGPGLMQLRLDTIYLLPDLHRVVMCQRGILPRRLEERAREVVLGHMTLGWLNARCKRLRYLDTTDLGGEIPAAVYFS
jgi:hypothetical protein